MMGKDIEGISGTHFRLMRLHGNTQDQEGHEGGIKMQHNEKEAPVTAPPSEFMTCRQEFYRRSIIFVDDSISPDENLQK